MSEGESKPIRVVDRRMFTPEGELRPDFEPEEPPPERTRPAPVPAAAAPPPTAPEPPVVATDSAAAAEGPPPPGAAPRSGFAGVFGSVARSASPALGCRS